MLLRSMLLDGPHRAVEQVMFTQIEYPASIDVSRVEVSSGGEQISWLEPKKLKATSGLPDILEEQVDRVHFKGLPEGYREVSETYSPMPSTKALTIDSPIPTPPGAVTSDPRCTKRWNKRSSISAGTPLPLSANVH